MEGGYAHITGLVVSMNIAVPLLMLGEYHRSECLLDNRKQDFMIKGAQVPCNYGREIPNSS